MKIKLFLLISILTPSIASVDIAQAKGTDLDTKVSSALQGELRSAQEIRRDANRKPLETLRFLGIKPDMNVLELIPGGGWYTKILAPTLRDEGKLSVALFASRVKDNLVNKEGMDKIKILDVDVKPGKGENKLNTLPAFEFGKSGFDAVLTFRNMHNFDAAGRASINNAVFKALKPGGIYGLVDHTRRHMEPHSSDNRRRADPVTIVKELLDAGFEFTAYSDLHFKPADALNLEVGEELVTGKTDRFTFLFKKPK